MKMKKLLAIGLSMAMTLSMLAGCGGNTPATSAPAEPAAEDTAEAPADDTAEAPADEESAEEEE